MNGSLVSQFAESLIKKTLSSEIVWRPLTEDMSFGGEKISDLLGTCEFHTVHYFESYFCALSDGFVFLISEINESGRDSRFDTEGFNLYVQTSATDPLVSVMFDTAELYRLSNAIVSKTEVPQKVAEFMKLFI